VVNVEKAAAYVQAAGDAVERARLASILRGEPPSEEALCALSRMQNADGGFSYWLPDRTISTVCDTAYVLAWFDDLSMRSGPLVDGAVRFLFENQRPDGGWDEVEGVRRLDPPEFQTPGETRTRVWLTAYCAHWLMRFGHAESPQCRGCPVDFLLAHQEPSGRLAGYLRATWDALPVFSRYPRGNSRPFELALAATETEFSPQEWEGSYLAWLLLCLRDAGLPASHSLVTRSLDRLVEPAGREAATGRELGLGGRGCALRGRDRPGAARAEGLQSDVRFRRRGGLEAWAEPTSTTRIRTHCGWAAPRGSGGRSPSWTPCGCRREG